MELPFVGTHPILVGTDTETAGIIPAVAEGNCCQPTAAGCKLCVTLLASIDPARHVDQVSFRASKAAFHHPSTWQFLCSESKLSCSLLCWEPIREYMQYHQSQDEARASILGLEREALTIFMAIAAATDTATA